MSSFKRCFQPLIIIPMFSTARFCPIEKWILLSSQLILAEMVDPAAQMRFREKKEVYKSGKILETVLQWQKTTQGKNLIKMYLLAIMLSSKELE